jgi:4-amino-4-deoxy-L-arabinose transferase-like glycosyltransferase
MSASPIPRRESLLVLAGCAALSLLAIAWSWHHHALLNYGDAVAHLNISRRVFDSRIPRFSELGSVWLPLPHILMLPFVQVYSWWASGIAGIIPSALAWLLACFGLYRLARVWLAPAPAVVALAFFALNPNLLYLQTTAMTEPLFLCEMIWLALLMVEFRLSLNPRPQTRDPRPQTPLNSESTRRLLPIALVLIAAIFTRYDGWIMALLAWTGIGLLLLLRRGLRGGLLRSPAFWLCTVLVIAAPLFWFAYNASAFGDWLYFARGPYSAAAIEVRTSAPGFPPHPGWHNPWVSLIFFVKCAELDAAPIGCGTFLLLTALFGAAWSWLIARRQAVSWALLLLWFPVPFYAYSVSFGSVPIFLPVWWPHSYYNLRYGLELLPAFALAIGFSAQFALAVVREFKPGLLGRPWQSRALAALLVLCLMSAIQMLRERPLVYVEGTKNIQAHRPYQLAIPPVLRSLLAARPASTHQAAPLLVITSVDPEIIALAGIPLRQTINESDLWIYDAALAAPASHAAIILAFDGDDIDHAVHAHPEHLTVVQRFTAPGQSAATIYVSDSPSFAAPQN